MARKYKIVTQTKDHKTIIAVDLVEENSIMTYLRSTQRHKNRFIAIAKLILERLQNRELYKWEKIDSEHNNVWAMRFLFKVIMIEFIVRKFLTETKKLL